MTEIAHARSKDTLTSTFNADTNDLLNEAGVEINNEADVLILSEVTAAWVVPVAHAKSESMAHVKLKEAYSAPLIDVVLNEAGVEINNEADVAILSENLLTLYVVELVHSV